MQEFLAFCDSFDTLSCFLFSHTVDHNLFSNFYLAYKVYCIAKGEEAVRYLGISAYSCEAQFTLIFGTGSWLTHNSMEAGVHDALILYPGH